MSERPKNQPEIPSEDFVESDGLPQELSEETAEEVDLLTRIEQAMLEEQKQAILEDPEISQHLVELDDEKLGRHMNERERVFLESYGRPGYHFAPADEKGATFEQLKTFFRHVPISPLLFQESIVSKVFHTKFVTKPNSEKRMKERQSRFDLLRYLFASLRPIYNKHAREMKKDRIRRMFVISLKQARGSILVTRKPGKRRINGVYPDAYSAKRSLGHILNTYEGRFTEREYEQMGELKTIRKLQNGTQFLIDFIQKWKTSTTEERNKASQLIVDARDLLFTCRNAYKVFASKDYDSSSDFVDSRGQVNPGATAAKLVKAYNELKKRVEEIVSIKKHIGEDKKILEAFLNQLDQLCFNAIRDIGNYLETPYFDKYEQKAGQFSRIKTEAREVDTSLFGGVDDYDKAKSGLMDLFQWMEDDARLPAPFPQYGNAVISNFRVVQKLNSHIASEKIPPEELKKLHDALTEYAIRGHVVLRYQFIQRRYAAILEDILDDPYKIKPEEVRSRIGKLLVKFRPHQYKLPFAIRDDLEIEIPEFDTVYDHMRDVSQKVMDWINARNSVQEDLKPLTDSLEDPSRGSKEDDVKIIERIQEFEDRLTKLEIEFINDLYGIISEFDFMVPLKALTVEDPKEVVDEIISSV